MHEQSEIYLIYTIVVCTKASVSPDRGILKRELWTNTKKSFSLETLYGVLSQKWIKSSCTYNVCFIKWISEFNFRFSNYCFFFPEEIWYSVLFPFFFLMFNINIFNWSGRKDSPVFTERSSSAGSSFKTLGISTHSHSWTKVLFSREL